MVLRFALPPFALLLAGAALVVAAPAAAVDNQQVYETRANGYTLRSSTVTSTSVDAATLQQHGIEQSPQRAVLNVTLMKGGGSTPPTVPADVSVGMRNLAGVHQEVPVREVRSDGRVSYVGSYVHLPREVIDFRVVAQPRDGGSGPPLVLDYRDRLWTER